MTFYPVKAYRHNGDHGLMSSLGLRTWNFSHEWTELGTVTVQEESKETYGQPPVSQVRPAATVKVEVVAHPDQFWRFTIVRQEEEIVELGETHGRKQWRVDYSTSTLVMETGSGGFGKYWEVAKLIAENMIVITNEEDA